MKTRILEKGGLTWDVKTNKEAVVKGYIVSLPNREVIIPLKDFKDEDVDNYVQANLDLLSLSGNYFGAWIDGESVVFDVSTMISSKEQSIRAGMYANQKAIFGEVEGEIRIPERQKSGTHTQQEWYIKSVVEKLCKY